MNDVPILVVSALAIIVLIVIMLAVLNRTIGLLFDVSSVYRSEALNDLDSSLERHPHKCRYVRAVQGRGRVIDRTFWNVRIGI